MVFCFYKREEKLSVLSEQREESLWHSVKTADSMREGNVLSASPGQNRSVLLVTIFLLTVQETAPVSRSVRTAVSIPAENALNAIAVHTR